MKHIFIVYFEIQNTKIETGVFICHLFNFIT